MAKTTGTRTAGSGKSADKRQDVYDVMKLLQAGGIMEQVSRKWLLSGATLDPKASKDSTVSSGLLMTDILMNGGMKPGGWYTMFGKEGSSKSTHMLTMCVNLVYSNVPLIAFYDSEQSNSPAYIESIASTLHKDAGGDAQKVFGVRNPDTGVWEIEPRIYYWNEHLLESTWKSASAMLRRLPDKVFLDGSWWLAFDRTKETISRFKGKTDKKLSDRLGKLVVPSEDGGTMQALILVDSYTGMVPEGAAADDDDASLALAARKHGENVPKVKGLLKKKHAALVGVNQLRDKPATRFGSPEYEPGGNALQFFSDVRISHRPRNVPHSTSDNMEQEESVETEGQDYYRYVLMRTTKNKLGAPNLEAWQRIWIKDPLGEARGYCPVWDTFQYLANTGQVVAGRGRKLEVTLPKTPLPVKLDWLDFKALILHRGTKLKEKCKKLGLDSNPRIRQKCFEQIADGSGLEMYFKKLAKTGGKK